ncbi:MAG: hypothetical protein V3W18_12090 [candidate division Zixibacteria bacterium]
MVSLKRSLTIIVIVLSVAIGLIALNCNRNPTESGIDEVLAGNWVWVYSFGGFGGQYIYPDSVGYDKSVSFGVNSMYTEMINDSTACHGRFRIEQKEVWNELAYVVIIDNYEFELIIERVDTDTLVLGEYCDDCYAHTYIRLHPI